MNSKIKKISRAFKRGKFAPGIVSKKDTNHLLLNGDCLEVMRFMPDRSVDLIITDPPYNQDLDYGNGFDDRRSRGEYLGWLKRRLEDVPRLLRPPGSFYLISYPEIAARLLPFLEDDLGLNFRRWITWHYPSNIGHSYKNFTRTQRSILFFTKNKSGYIFNKNLLEQPYKNPTAPVIKERLKEGYTGRMAYDFLESHDIDVLKINLLKNNSKDRYRNLESKFRPVLSNKELKKIDHPCQLPLLLLEILVAVSSKKGHIVLDPFAGTFTTSVAAGKHGRDSIGIELNGKYVAFGLKRLKRL